jgi:hypothetical protein
MPDSPSNNADKLNRILTAWKTLAADKSFAGMTVSQFETAIGPSFDARDQLETLDDQRTHLINTRNDADDASLAKAAAVVAGVQADPTFGPNSSLYEAMGYVRKSERSSGLKRGPGGPPPPPVPPTPST